MRNTTSGDSADTPLPWEFEVGSAESRAAARAMLESRERNVRRIQLVHHVPRGGKDDSVPRVGPWRPTDDGGLLRLVYVPSGTDEETTRRLLDTP
jgi:hypothetical protein